MTIDKQLLAGMNVGYHETYLSADGILMRRTNWIRIIAFDPAKRVIAGWDLHTTYPVYIHADLAHTTSSPFEHI